MDLLWSVLLREFRLECETHLDGALIRARTV